MGKKIIALISAMAICLSSVCAYAAESRKIKHMYEDFEKYAGGTTGVGMQVITNGAAVQLKSEKKLNGNAMCIDYSDCNLSGAVSVEQFLLYQYSTTEKMSWSAKMMFSNSVLGGGFVIVGKNTTGGNLYPQNAKFNNGVLELYDKTTLYKSIPLEKDTEYSFEYEIDTANKKYSFYVNGVKEADNLSLATDGIVSISQLRLIASQNESCMGNIYIDDFTVWKYTEAPNIAPVITWQSAEEIDLNNLDTITVSASDEDGEVSSAELYVDGILYKEITKAPFEFDVSGVSLGRHDIKVVVYDNEGLSTQKEVELQFVRNEKELIEVTTNLTDTVDYNNLNKIIISCTGNESELGKAMLYSDGVLIKKITKAPFEFSKEDITPGMHDITIVVYDELMNKGTFKKQVVFRESVNVDWINGDFESYTGGTNIGNGISVLGDTFASEAKEIEDGYGISGYFSMAEGDFKSEKAAMYLRYIPNTADSFVWQSSLYFDKIPDAGYFQAVCKNSSDANAYMQNIEIKEGKIKCYNGAVVGYEETLETGKFYDFVYALNSQNKTYSFSINNILVADGFSYRIDDVVSVSELRLVLEYNKGDGVGFGVDNFILRKTALMPYITNAEYAEGYIKVTLTDAKNTGDMKLLCEGDEVDLEKTESKEGVVTVYPKNKLLADMTYTLSFIPKITIDSKEYTGKANNISIIVPGNKYGVKNAKFSQLSDEINAEIMLYNNTDKDEQALIILNMYKEGRIVKSIAKSVNVTANTDEEGCMLDVEEYDNTCDIKIFILNSWKDRTSFTNKIFYY